MPGIKRGKKRVIISFGRHVSARDFAEVTRKYKGFKGTFVVENPVLTEKEAKTAERALARSSLKHFKGFLKAEAAFARAVKKRGGKIRVLEYPASSAERQALKKDYEKMRMLNAKVEKELKEKKFDEAFKTFKKTLKHSKFVKRIDKLIASRVRSLKDEDILIRYGAFHTAIYHELKKAGVDVKREMSKPYFFDILGTAFRKIYFQKLLTDIDIWRALILRTGKFSVPTTPSVRIKTLVKNVLLSNVQTSQEAKKIMKKPKEGVRKLLFKANFPVRKYFEEENYSARNKILLEWLSRKITIPFERLRKL